MCKYNVIGIDMGHPVGCGAYGLVSETDKNREVGKELIYLLTTSGIKVVNCTIDKKYNNDLAQRVLIANKAKVDLYISIHLDSFSNPDANGVTVFTTTTSGAKEIAKKVVDNVSNCCGYKNRGLKHKSFYVIKNTIAPAFLIECGFVTNKEDCKRFNAKKIAKAIFDVITEYDKVDIKNNKKRTILSPRHSNEWCAKLQKEFNIQGYRDYNGNVLIENGYPGPLTLSAAKKCPIYLNVKGNITRLLQDMITVLGYDVNRIDGYCGYGMIKAIKEYQTDNKLRVDGSFGPECWKSILGL